MGRASGRSLEQVVAQTVGNPAAATDWTANPTAAGELIAVTATLTTSATVANRTPALQVLDAGAHILLNVPAATALAASLTGTYTWMVGGPYLGANNNNLAPIPAGLVIPATFTVKAVTANLSAGDQWTNIVLAFAGQ